MSRFVAITAVRDFEGRVRQAISGALHGELQTLSPAVLTGGPEDVFKQLSGAPPEVLILGPGVTPEDALKLATVFDLQYPEISLLLIADPSPELVLKAMHSGIRDVVSSEIGINDLRVLLERAWPRVSQPSPWYGASCGRRPGSRKSNRGDVARREASEKLLSPRIWPSDWEK